MSVSQVEGKVLAAPVKFNRRGVVRFDHIELERSNSPATRNCRRAAIRDDSGGGAFFE